MKGPVGQQEVATIAAARTSKTDLRHFWNDRDILTEVRKNGFSRDMRPINLEYTIWTAGNNIPTRKIFSNWFSNYLPWIPKCAQLTASVVFTQFHLNFLWLQDICRIIISQKTSVFLPMLWIWEQENIFLLSRRFFLSTIGFWVDDVLLGETIECKYALFSKYRHSKNIQ